MTDRTPAVTDDMVERAAVRLAGHFRGDEGQWRGYWDCARLALEAGLDGRVPVDLPEPDHDQDADLNPDIPVWTVGAFEFQSEAGRVSVVWGVDGLGADGRMIRPDLAEKTAHALLVAAREARRLAEEAQR